MSRVDDWYDRVFFYWFSLVIVAFFVMVAYAVRELENDRKYDRDHHCKMWTHSWQGCGDPEHEALLSCNPETRERIKKGIGGCPK
jgi:hypothetical protein